MTPTGAKFATCTSTRGESRRSADSSSIRRKRFSARAWRSMAASSPRRINSSGLTRIACSIDSGNRNSMWKAAMRFRCDHCTKSVSTPPNFFAMPTPTRAPTWMRCFAEADRDKVFGVPTFIVDGEPFWGEDRIEWVIQQARRDGPSPLRLSRSRDRNVPRLRFHALEPRANRGIACRDRIRLHRRHACRHRARCPRSSSGRRRTIRAISRCLSITPSASYPRGASSYRA